MYWDDMTTCVSVALSQEEAMSLLAHLSQKLIETAQASTGQLGSTQGGTGQQGSTQGSSGAKGMTPERQREVSSCESYFFFFY